MYISEDTLTRIYICMDIICEVDRFSHGLNQTIIEQFQGKLTPKKKTYQWVNGKSVAHNTTSLIFQPRALSAFENDKCAFRPQLNKGPSVNSTEKAVIGNLLMKIWQKFKNAKAAAGGKPKELSSPSDLSVFHRPKASFFERLTTLLKQKNWINTKIEIKRAQILETIPLKIE